MSCSRHDAAEVDSAIWRAVAGVRIPSVNSYFYYSPQRHLEQCSASSAVNDISSAEIHCQVVGIRFLSVDDRLFAKITLQPTDGRQSTHVGAEDEDEDDVISFAKVLTQTDLRQYLFVPKNFMNNILPQVKCRRRRIPIVVRDTENNMWEFCYSRERYCDNLGKGGGMEWLKFVKAKRLLAGDSVVFVRRGVEIFFGVRSATRFRSGMRFAEALPEVIKAEVIKAVNGSAFEVVYIPDVGFPDFIKVVEETTPADEFFDATDSSVEWSEMDVARQTDLQEERMSDHRSISSNYWHCSQSRKISVRVLVDSNSKANETGPPIAETESYSKRNVTPLKEKCEIVEPKNASPWVSTRSFNPKLSSSAAGQNTERTPGFPATGSTRCRSKLFEKASASHSLKFFDAKSGLESDLCRQNIFGKDICSTEVGKVDDAKRMENQVCSTEQGVQIEMEQVQGKDRTTETGGHETLRMKLWEILGNVSSPNKHLPSFHCEDLHLDQERNGKQRPIEKINPNSDTIESDSQTHVHTRPMTRSLNRRKDSTRKQSKESEATKSIDINDCQRKRILSFKGDRSGGFYDNINDGSSPCKRKKILGMSSGLEIHEGIMTKSAEVRQRLEKSRSAPAVEKLKDESHKDCRESEELSPEVHIPQNILHDYNISNDNAEDVGVIGYSPASDTLKGIQDTSELEMYLEENYEDGLTRAVARLTVDLAHVKTKLKSISSRRSADILRTAVEEILYRLRNAESLIKTDVGKLTKLSHSKKEQLETRFQEKQEELLGIHKRFKAEVEQHLKDFGGLIGDLREHQFVLKRSFDKQRTSHKKFLYKVEDEINVQLDDTERRIMDVEMMAREKMRQLKVGLAECLKHGDLS